MRSLLVLFSLGAQLVATPAVASPALRTIVEGLAAGLAGALVTGDARYAKRSLHRAGERALRSLGDRALAHLAEHWAAGMPAVEHIRRCRVCRKAARAMTRGNGDLRDGLNALLHGHGGLPDEVSIEDVLPPPPPKAYQCLVPTQWGMAACQLMVPVSPGATCWCQFPNGMRSVGHAR